VRAAPGGARTDLHLNLPRHQRHAPRDSLSPQDPKVCATRHPILPTRAVASLVPAGLEGQLPAVFDAQVASADAQQFLIRWLEQPAPSLMTFQDRAPRDEPPYISGTETEHLFDVPAELRSKPGVVHLSDCLDGGLVVGHTRPRA
jgi:hypothetical protein